MKSSSPKCHSAQVEALGNHTSPQIKLQLRKTAPLGYTLPLSNTAYMASVQSPEKCSLTKVNDYSYQNSNKSNYDYYLP